MARIFGLAVTAVWLVFTLMAFRSASQGWDAGQVDVGFWWTVTGVLLGLATLVALVGTLRYRYHGPAK
jgi:hypothetical protein